MVALGARGAANAGHALNVAEGLSRVATDGALIADDLEHTAACAPLAGHPGLDRGAIEPARHWDRHRGGWRSRAPEGDQKRVKGSCGAKRGARLEWHAVLRYVLSAQRPSSAASEVLPLRRSRNLRSLVSSNDTLDSRVAKRKVECAGRMVRFKQDDPIEWACVFRLERLLRYFGRRSARELIVDDCQPERIAPRPRDRYRA
jgi:hypothetical protein